MSTSRWSVLPCRFYCARATLVLAVTALAACSGSMGGGRDQPGDTTGPGTNPGSGGGSPGSGGGQVDPGSPFMPMPTPGPMTVAVAGERWSDPATWGGRVPADGDQVVIPGGKTVLVDVDPARLAGLTVRGTLVFDDRDVNLTTDFILVERGGRFQLGTADKPFLKRAVITLTGHTNDQGIFGSKYFGVQDGILDIHGAPVARSWTVLDRETTAGATSITLAEAPGWKPGDRIVIASSTYEMNDYDLAEVAAVNGKEVTLRAPLRHPHFGMVRRVEDTVVDVRAEVGLLNRNILITGDEASVAQRVGAHMMFISSHETTIRLSNIEVTRAGQFNRLGRYPIHFHIIEDRCKGCYVRDVSVHDTIQRGLVIHDTESVLVQRNVVFNTVGHNIIVETPTSRGSAYRENLALVNVRPQPDFTVPLLKAQNDDIPGNFWVKNARNEFTGNHAAGSVGIGFFFDATSESPLLFQRNTVHAAMARGALRDFVIQGGFLLMCAHEEGDSLGPGSKVTDVLMYQNGMNGFWPEQCTTFRDGMHIFEISRLQLIDNQVTNIQMRGQQDVFKIDDALFTEHLLDPRHRTGPAVHFQYGATLTLTRPVFAHMTSSVFATNDILGAWVARLRVEGARFVNADKARIAQPAASDGLLEALDDSFMPRGSYLSVEGGAPTLSAPGCRRHPSEDLTIFYCPTTPVVGALVVAQNVPAGPESLGYGSPMHVVTDLRREDGAVFPRRDYGFGGFEVAANTGLTYRLMQEPAGRVTVGFDPMGSVTSGIDRTSVVRLAIPMSSAPRAVLHSRANDSGEIYLPGTRMTAAANLGALGNDQTAYFYDASARLLHLNASHRSVIIER